ncbi:L-seryl-tRNA(Sec) selenium transferase [Corynebacterium halotolerans]|uniref:L-seryl-tRNA(Sec) selenium transferase n=1 Tax=Corynebacterium halotolerans YIM 70093 = DSM 44683 TaxID=1121362 RepID=M1NX61_9CORY|nr:L-seryl-tRNA(Sec) selenium transferase [Corynebacterium halotolerans]AGF72075.1 selenocysteine synthase [Corynebacterium halotolerans YIM 70093 = DSM 44683]
MGNGDDPRRRIPRTDQLLALPEVAAARARLSETRIRAIIRGAQDDARRGGISPEEVTDTVVGTLAATATSTLTPVLNATGVIVHTNLGRAPLSAPAREALTAAAGYVDVELDLATGLRSRTRGAGARAALLAACPAAEDALVVNNGAAALLLATTALADGGEIIISRGELIEIGAGFRLPELIETTGSRLREIGATNRTHPADYVDAVTDRTRALLKVHPSNFRVEGFTSSVDVPELRRIADEHDLALIADLGSGLLTPDPVLPDEPDIDAALRAGADVVIASGDKLLGGPQAGILLGRAEVIARLKRHPLARALRVDKLTLAALEATVAGGPTPVQQALHPDTEQIRRRTGALAEATGGRVVEHDGRVGGGGAPGHPLPGLAVELPEALAPLLRAGGPVVLARVHQGACLIDLRCVPPHEDDRLTAAVTTALTKLTTLEEGN